MRRRVQIRTAEGAAPSSVRLRGDTGSCCCGHPICVFTQCLFIIMLLNSAEWRIHCRNVHATLHNYKIKGKGDLLREQKKHTGRMGVVDRRDSNCQRHCHPGKVARCCFRRHLMTLLCRPKASGTTSFQIGGRYRWSRGEGASSPVAATGWSPWMESTTKRKQTRSLKLCIKHLDDSCMLIHFLKNSIGGRKVVSTCLWYEDLGAFSADRQNRHWSTHTHAPNLVSSVWLLCSVII